MAEEILRTITAGSRDVYQIVRAENGNIILRMAENHDTKIELISSVLGTLIQALRDVEQLISVHFPYSFDPAKARQAAFVGY
jgi:hypothetical protein